MTTVGQNIAGGSLVVASVDPTGTYVLSATVPADKSDTGVPFTISLEPGQTVATLEALIG